MVAEQELASLSERMGYMQALRAALVVVIVGSAVVAPKTIGASLSDLVLLCGAYLILSASVEGLRRFFGKRGIAIVEGMLLVDAVYLALACYATGGTQSPLRFLIYIHIIGVTLLASYRTGIKIALWHALLFFVTFYAQAAEILPSGNNGALPRRPSLFNVVAMMLVAVGTMVFSSVNERELRRRKTDLEALNDTAKELEDVSDPSSVAQILVDGVCEQFGFRKAIVVAAPPEGTLKVLAGRGVDLDEVAALDRVPSVISRAWTARDAQLVRKLEPEGDAPLGEWLGGATNVAVLPLFAETHPIGALIVQHASRKARIERRVLAAVSQFTAHAALALRNAWLLQDIQRMAETDGLTGIANRRTFEMRLERELSRATRNGEQVTLVMLDIDHFKKLNDAHGHQVGDEVLQAAAAALASSCRDFDTPARYGGEEFAVILPACSPQESLPAGDRLRAAIAGSGSSVPVTASAGVATFPIHAGDPQALIKAADEALYESKRSGRNRVSRSRRRSMKTAETIEQV